MPLVNKRTNGAVNETWMYQHMSCHYRKILSAKKVVDTSPPQSYTRRASPATSLRTSHSYSSVGYDVRHHVRYPESHVSDDLLSEVDVLDRMVYDSKFGPLTYCSVKGELNTTNDPNNSYRTIRQTRNTIAKSNITKRRPLSQIGRDSSQHRVPRIRPLVPADLLDRHSDEFTSLRQFHPRVLKHEARSKVKELHVYHPPRRKHNTTNWVDNDEVVSPHQCKHRKRRQVGNCKCDQVKTQSQTSSRDSAYNGGVSSLPESRSPTPDKRGGSRRNRLLKGQRKGKEESNITQTIRVDENTDSTGQGNKSPIHQPFYQSTPKKSQHQQVAQRKKSLQQEREDVLYIQLIEDITSEVLEKGLYTNKSVKNVIQRHVQRNSSQLKVERMSKEVEQLMRQLGIPEDDNQDEVNFGLGPTDIDLSSTLAIPEHNNTTVYSVEENNRVSSTSGTGLNNVRHKSLPGENETFSCKVRTLQDKTRIETFSSEKQDNVLKSATELNASGGIEQKSKVSLKEALTNKKTPAELEAVNNSKQSSPNRSSESSTESDSSFNDNDSITSVSDGVFEEDNIEEKITIGNLEDEEVREECDSTHFNKAKPTTEEEDTDESNDIESDSIPEESDDELDE